MMPSCQDSTGAFLIDRSPKYFEPILNYLRTGTLIIDPNVNPEGVLEEAKYYGIDSLIPKLERLAHRHTVPRDEKPLTRRDVVDVLIGTSTSSSIRDKSDQELRFQGTNLEGADLSKLDLRHINFKYANLEAANLKGSNFEDPAGSRANLEGVNLKGANLEGSIMAGINLRVATLKNVNMQNCDLRMAVLAGADLENCNLSGSDLHEANLRGANLKDATLELMLTPLHMSQTIR